MYRCTVNWFCVQLYCKLIYGMGKFRGQARISHWRNITHYKECTGDAHYKTNEWKFHNWPFHTHRQSQIVAYWAATFAAKNRLCFGGLCDYNKKWKKKLGLNRVTHHWKIFLDWTMPSNKTGEFVFPALHNFNSANVKYVDSPNP